MTAQATATRAQPTQEPRALFAWLPDARKPLLAAALAYGAHRMAVFPVAGKVPMTSHGFRSASCDPDTIRRWRWDRATGIGWALPASVFVLDVDGEPGISALLDLEREHGHLPLTLQAVTGRGGLHVVLRAPPGMEVRQTAGEIADGLDTRTDRGYVVVAPSRHPATGLAYRWQTRAPVALAPPWLVDLIRIPPPRPFTPQETREVSDRYAAAVLRAVCAEMAAMGEGGRNAKLFAAWARCTRDGLPLDRDLVRAELTRAALAAGLTLPEITRTLR